MEFIEDEELQPLHLVHQTTLSWPGEHQLQHDVVGQQNVGRILDDFIPLRATLLSGVAAIGNRGPVEALLEELVQLIYLAVGQRIHRIDDDRLNPLAAPPAQDVVNDGHDVGQALA